LKKLLQLQAIDLKIEKYLAREKEIPMQKEKFNIKLQRLTKELEESEQRCKTLKLEQRSCEGDIEQRQADIRSKDAKLMSVKRNEEYQALLHEMELLKKQIGLKEERILSIMMDLEASEAQYEEDKKRIAREQAEIEEELKNIDEELAKAIAERQELEKKLRPLADTIEPKLLSQYKRIRRAKKTGAVVVPLHGETCSGCHMMIRAQIVNEILAAHKFHPCSYCGRLLYADDVMENEALA